MGTKSESQRPESPKGVRARDKETRHRLSVAMIEGDGACVGSDLGVLIKTGRQQLSFLALKQNRVETKTKAKPRHRNIGLKAGKAGSEAGVSIAQEHR